MRVTIKVIIIITIDPYADSLEIMKALVGYPKELYNICNIYPITDLASYNFYHQLNKQTHTTPHRFVTVCQLSYILSSQRSNNLSYLPHGKII